MGQMNENFNVHQVLTLLSSQNVLLLLNYALWLWFNLQVPLHMIMAIYNAIYMAQLQRYQLSNLVDM
mgnify:CR=1 FL=1